MLDEGPAPYRVEPHYGCGSRPPTGFRAAQRAGPGHEDEAAVAAEEGTEVAREGGAG